MSRSKFAAFVPVIKRVIAINRGILGLEPRTMEALRGCGEHALAKLWQSMFESLKTENSQLARLISEAMQGKAKGE